MFSEEQVEKIRHWAAGKSWIPRALLWLGLAYISVRHVDLEYASIFSGLNLGIHEAGHLFLGHFGSRFLAILGGTLFELGAPIGAAVMFYRQPDYFALVFCGVWLGTGLMSAARYCADARALELPLVTVSRGAKGDSECSFGVTLHISFHEIG